MTSENYKGIFSSTVKALSDVGENSPMVHLHKHGVPMPSVDRLKVFMELMHGVMFPGYFMESDIDEHNIDYYIGARLDKAVFLLSEEIRRGKCFECQVADENECTSCQLSSKEIAVEFVAQLPEIRRLLSLDVEAAYEGDPAAVSQGETIFCYPSINVMTHYRIAHALYQLEVPLIPRIITEMAHAENGVDIHPQAQIGEKFFMDHGTGIVVGGTCIIGNNVKLYHGVTLGAKSLDRKSVV